MGDFNGENYKDNFISELVTFVAGEAFQTMFESFFIEYAMQFSSAEEHELKYYEIYQKFHKMFEGQLEDFCNRLNVTESEFMIQCRAAREKDEKAKHYIDILLSSVEYETFVKLMKIMRPVAESRISSKADAKKKETEGEGAAKKESAQRPGAQAKLPVAASSKEIQEEEEEEEDPFAPEKGIPRSNSEGKGTSNGSGGFAREEEGEFAASDAKSDRYNSGMADSKDSSSSK